jgi:hypothetical protein
MGPEIVKPTRTQIGRVLGSFKTAQIGFGSMLSIIGAFIPRITGTRLAHQTRLLAVANPYKDCPFSLSQLHSQQISSRIVKKIFEMANKDMGKHRCLKV